ncbi:hypothetical protein KM043_014002 [Ampulex compressa]|nr:hypothetical protein KM043_014002 [Ampulex compressa]
MNAEKVKVGCFQVVLALLLGVNYVIVAMSHAISVFHNYTPNFYCEERNTTNRTFGCQNIKNVTFDANLTHDSLGMPQSGLCSAEYQFQTEYGESSVVTEWKLICERRYLTFLGPTIYYVGVLLGAWISGILADRIGRLPVQAICLYTQGTMAVALYVVQSYPTFLALRGLQGVFVQGLQNSTYILSLELFPAKARTFIALVMQIAWAFGLILLAVLSYVIPDWRILQLAISVPTAITVLYIWIMPESPRWLLAKGKATEADMAFERIAKYNACCSKSGKRITVKSVGSFKENIIPLKPERKSRVTSVDLKKANTNDETKNEVTNLLTKTEIEQQKDQKTSSKQTTKDTQKRISNNAATMEIRQCGNAETEKRDTPSSSKCHRKSKSISQPVCNQRISAKSDRDVVEFTTSLKSDRVNEKKPKICRDADKRQDMRNDQNMKKLLGNLLLRKYSLVMVFQW